jgi:S-phase kinase-associated protein 1
MDLDSNSNSITMNMISSDGQTFPVHPNVARMCTIHADIMEEDDEDITDFDLHCAKVPGEVLAKVIEYCNHYQTVEKMVEFKTPFHSEELAEIVQQPWYVNFIQANRTSLAGLIQASNYLNVQPLLKLSCLAFSISIKGKSVEELKKIFNVQPPLIE